MANIVAPFGLRPVRRRDGSEWNGKVRPYLVPTGVATDVFVGDPVDLAGTSNATTITVIGGEFQPGTLPTVALATLADGNYTIGPIVGFMPTTRDSEIYGPSATNRVALVADDPNLIFEIQDDGAAVLGVAGVGLNAIMQTGSGSTATGKSGYVLDTNGTAPSADASNMLLIERAANRVGNDATLASTIWEVSISMHRLARLNGLLGVA
jgi:hypothetical protein